MRTDDRGRRRRRSPSGGGLAFWARACRSLLALLAAAALPAAASAQSGRPLTIDDVLDASRIDRATISPDGEWIAAVVQRPARPGEVYGRTYYELDPARGDIWLISRRTGERRNLTAGAEAAAGFWCAIWSPDGRRLAMLSTRPEGAEPRGGDNVRLYVWDRGTNMLARASQAALTIQTMGGSSRPRLHLRGGADGSTVAHRCGDDENAPFAWLDDRRLLAVTLPAGGVSSLIDVAARPMLHAGETLRRLREGVEPTVTAAGSGAERAPADGQAHRVLLQVIDVGTRDAATIAALPFYPFRGELVLSIAPDRRRIAVLANVGTIPPQRGEPIPFVDESWAAERRLGLVDLAPGAAVRWAALPPDARYPLSLHGWSPDGRQIALRARANTYGPDTPLFLVTAADLSVRRAGSALASIGGPLVRWTSVREAPVLWIDDGRLLAQASRSGSRADWWLVDVGGQAVNLTAGLAEPPDGFQRTPAGLVALAGNGLLRLDADARRLDPVASVALAGPGSIAWPQDPARETSTLIVAARSSAGDQRFEVVSWDGTQRQMRFRLPEGAELLDADPAHAAVLARHATMRGLFLRETALAGGAGRSLLSLNAHLADVDWGRTLLVDYRGGDGQPLKAAVILPPGYRPGRRYPTITWIYPGHQVRDLRTYFLDPNLPGIYNLRLYAARGYVVLIPSMPLTTTGGHRDFFLDLTKGVLPAVDRLVERGIADPDRVGVMGQSFGGYGVYGLVTQTTRFRAAVALAGATDLAAGYLQFDPLARNYPGIEHERSEMAPMFEAGALNLGTPPYEDIWRYWRNSPIAFADRVQTPLLLIHGEQDERASMAHAETFFNSLYRQGKTARLLRYWGENHGLAQSPANIRSIHDEILSWFDRYLRGDPAGAARPGP